MGISIYSVGTIFFFLISASIDGTIVYFKIQWIKCKIRNWMALKTNNSINYSNVFRRVL